MLKVKNTWVSFRLVRQTRLTRILSLIALIFSVFPVRAQHPYTVANAHSHNDYNQATPFFLAYNAGFGSIEADVILKDTTLFVGHNLADTVRSRTLQSLYLDPLKKIILQNHGLVYHQRNKSLLLLIDLKTAAEPTLKRIVDVLGGYPAITKCKTLKIVITGNQPTPIQFAGYPSYIYFDGNLKNDYTRTALQKVALFSDNFKLYSKWNGAAMLPKTDSLKIATAITRSHEQKKPIRFWNAPDHPAAWEQLIKFGVDFINTDSIVPFTRFINTQ